MALANVTSTIWSARITEYLIRQTLWAGLCNRNYEGEVIGHGTVKIPTFTGSTTVKDYTPNMDIEDGELATYTTQDMTIDQLKYFNVYADDADQVQTPVRMIEDLSRDAGEQIGLYVDNYLAGIWTDDANVNAGRTVTLGKQAEVFKGGTAALRQTAARAFLAGVSDIKKRMFAAGVDQGLNGWFLVIHEDIFALVEKYMTDGNGVDYGGLTGQTVQMGFAGNLLGFPVYVNTLIPKTSAKQYKCVVAHPNAVTLANELQEVVPYMPEKRFGEALKGLYVYGAKFINENFNYRLGMFYDEAATS